MTLAAFGPRALVGSHAARLGACGIWSIWSVAPAVLGACGALGTCSAWLLRHLAPAASGDCGAWRHFLFELALRPSEAQMSLKSVFSGCPRAILSSKVLLGTLDASNVLQYAVHNFYSYHCLFDQASRSHQSQAANKVGWAI